VTAAAPTHARLFLSLLLGGSVLLVAGCGAGKKPVTAQVPAPPPSPTESTTQPPLVAPEHAKVLWTEVGIASWYGPEFHNRRAANGEIYDMHQPTAAHRTLPFNSLVRVTNLSNGQSTLVRINDRGPFVEGRIIDLSLEAAKAIGVWRTGTAKVKLEVLQTPGPIATGGRWCVQIGAFEDRDAASSLKAKLARKYKTAKIIQFTGPTGEWLRIRVPNDERERAKQMSEAIHPSEGEVWLVRMD
jgi:peptidoglycan lytic transglycosylase